MCLQVLEGSTPSSPAIPFEVLDPWPFLGEEPFSFFGETCQSLLGFGEPLFEAFEPAGLLLDGLEAGMATDLACLQSLWRCRSPTAPKGRERWPSVADRVILPVQLNAIPTVQRAFHAMRYTRVPGPAT